MEERELQNQRFWVISLSQTCDFLGYGIKVEVLLRHQEVLLRHQEVMLWHQEILLRHQEVSLWHQGQSVASRSKLLH